MENKDEQTDKTDDTGKKDDNISKDDKTLSLYDKTEAMVTRQEEANKKTEELLTRQETLHANQRLAGTGGGHVEAKQVSEEDKKTEQAQEYFKDTALGDAIKKVSDKK